MLPYGFVAQMLVMGQESYNTFKDKLKNGKLIPKNPHKACNESDFTKKRQISEIGTKR